MLLLHTSGNAQVILNRLYALLVKEAFGLQKDHFRRRF